MKLVQSTAAVLAAAVLASTAALAAEKLITKPVERPRIASR